MHDYTQADLDPVTRGMLDFAAKLTRTPTSMEQSDVQKLRILGLSDEQILSVVLIACVFNFEVPEERQQEHERWLTGAATQQDRLMKQKV